ncbi:MULTISPECIES: hypothetical protein [Streptomyces]|uniref:hypothetical protein n=1 Tax=Streptomyces TaxID=1883 RepID=UPI00224902AC|nr:hypothetical protein [Streptomyces sp. JHD 1]MCX2971499.1 hypothetical protein [Streptomyces sp. JHD 1]
MSNPSQHNPYGQPPPQGQPAGQQQYGYPQQPPAQPGYGYPQQAAYPQPGMAPAQPQGMPGQVVTARVLLFIAGSVWTLLGLLMLILGVAAEGATDDIPGLGDAGDFLAGAAIIMFLLFLGFGALHIVPASMFGKGGTGTRVTAIIAASLNALIALLALLSAFSSEGGNPILALLWVATAVLTIVFCAMGQASAWFNRPRY